MNLTTGTAFWPLKDGQPSVYPPLRANEECEILVIGGGVNGAFVAHALTASGVNTVLVDRRDVATGSTGASTSLLQYEPDLPLRRLIQLRGEDEAVRCYRACRAALDDIARLTKKLGPSCRFAARKSLLLASRERDVPPLKHEWQIRRKHGFDVEFWPRRQLADASSLRHAGALFSPDAAVIDAYALTHALLRAAQRAGLRIFERTAVTQMRATRGGIIAHTDRRLNIRARKVVLAAGYEAQKFLRRPLGKLHSTYAIATLPVDSFAGWPDDCLLWDTARPYVYARRTFDGRAIIGGFDESFRDPRARDALLPAKSAALLRKLRSFFPEMTCETAYAWTGTFAETEDSLPYIGVNPDQASMYVSLGYGGNGIIFSQLAAGIIRDHHFGQRNPQADLFRLDR